MIVAPNSRASASASALFPDAVAPTMTRSGRSSLRVELPPEASLELIPGEQHDGSATMHVMWCQRRAREIRIQGPHLLRRQRIARFDRRFARDRRGEALVLRVRARVAVAG